MDEINPAKVDHAGNELGGDVYGAFRDGCLAGVRAVAGTAFPRSAPILTKPAPGWRKTALDATAHIPSGYTYLAQLLGHDMGRSVDAADFPNVEATEYERVLPTAAPDARGNGTRLLRYNLIRNPLTLETIYGPVPGMLSHLYDPATLLFRLRESMILAEVFEPTAQHTGAVPSANPIRALYDERNRDTLMLHELAVVWMQYHNQLARRFRASGMEDRAALSQARNHAVATWHKIIRQDILPKFVHPDIMALSKAELAREWRLNEITLLHGLFRAFHSLPLASYLLGDKSGRQNLDLLMNFGITQSTAEANWEVDWALFFGKRDCGPQSGISASHDAGLRMPKGLIGVLDLGSAEKAQPYRPMDGAIKAALASGGGRYWRVADYLQQVMQEFNAQFPGAGASDLTVTDLETGPLYYFLQIEAQVFGQTGGFGPFGSALLRASIEASLGRVALGDRLSAKEQNALPGTMLDLITLVRSEKDGKEA